MSGNNQSEAAVGDHRSQVADPAVLKITNLPEANQFLRREYRPGWTLG
jgi:hypothetical protein